FSQMLNFKSLLKANEILENVESIKELNKENYSSIKVEMNENYLEVIGETTIVNHTEGIDGNFQFFKLSQEPLFDASGHIRADVSFSQLAEFVWFSETGTGYTGKADSPLLGVFEGRAIYLLYNGILKDITDEGGNILTKQVFDVLPKFDGAKVIYAAANRLGIKAKRKNIVFKQTPYALEV
ncbi:site-specific DNA-methyltransferase, partial [Acinetobacter ursingii]|nr:site-specific DNA-methyltransferase [Acinetobacter ursingii]